MEFRFILWYDKKIEGSNYFLNKIIKYDNLEKKKDSKKINKIATIYCGLVIGRRILKVYSIEIC